MAWHCVSVAVDGIPDRRRHAQQAVNGDQPVLGFAVAAIAGAYIEIGVWVLEVGIVGNLRRMALLACEEVIRAAAADDERDPRRVGRVRRRAAPVDLDALEKIVGMAKQALRSRADWRLPIGSTESCVSWRKIDRAWTGGVRASRRMASGTGDVLTARHVLMAGRASQRDRRARDGKGLSERVRIGAGDGKQAGMVREVALRCASIGVTAQTRDRIARVTRGVRRRDRRAQGLVRREDAPRAVWQMTNIATRPSEIELGVRPIRVAQPRAVALVARREVAAACRVDPEYNMFRPRLAVLGYEPSRPGIVSVTQEASRGSAGCDGTGAEPEVAGGRRNLSAVGNHLVSGHAWARRDTAALGVATGAVHVLAGAGVHMACGAARHDGSAGERDRAQIRVRVRRPDGEEADVVLRRDRRVDLPVRMAGQTGLAVRGFEFDRIWHRLVAGWRRGHCGMDRVQVLRERPWQRVTPCAGLLREVRDLHGGNGRERLPWRLVARETRHRGFRCVMPGTRGDVEHDRRVRRIVLSLVRGRRIRDRRRHLGAGMALQAEKRSLLSFGGIGPDEIRDGGVE